MNESDLELLNAELVVIWKKLEHLEREMNGMGPRTAPYTTYLKELRTEAEKLLRQKR